METVRRLRRWLRRSDALSLVLMMVALLGFRSAIADWHDVPTGSMQPTLLVGDRIFVNKLAYDLKVPLAGLRVATWGDPERGDIITCRSPADGKRLVKRVVGVPGDVLEMRENRLIVNGREAAYLPADEPALRALVGAAADHWEFRIEELPGQPHVVAFAGGGTRRSLKPVVVAAGHYFLLGDNRDQSADSRWFGFLAREDVAGKVVGLAGSLDIKRQFRPRWSRFFRSVC